jgi:PAS domain-containing protein
MGDVLGSRLRKGFGGIAVVIFLAMSGYLLLELVIALSDQGQPTGAVVPVTDANPTYPDWYQAPDVLTALSVALVVYPVAAVFYGIGLLAGYLGREAPQPARPMPPDLAVEPSPAAQRQVTRTLAEPIEEACILDGDLVIRSVSTPMARLFGLTPREMIGLSAEIFIAPRDVSAFASLLLAAHGDSGQVLASTMGIRLPDDTILPVDVTCRVAREAANVGLGALALTFHALSERGQLDNKLAAIWY